MTMTHRRLRVKVGGQSVVRWWYIAVSFVCQGRGEAVNMTQSTESTVTSSAASSVFKYPYSELMLWAILLRRQQMARFMWQMGDEALAKVCVCLSVCLSQAVCTQGL